MIFVLSNTLTIPILSVDPKIAVYFHSYGNSNSKQLMKLKIWIILYLEGAIDQYVMWKNICILFNLNPISCIFWKPSLLIIFLFFTFRNILNNLDPPPLWWGIGLIYTSLLTIYMEDIVLVLSIVIAFSIIFFAKFRSLM